MCIVSVRRKKNIFKMEFNEAVKVVFFTFFASFSSSVKVADH